MTRAELAAIGLRTIGDLYRAQSPILAHLLGESPPGAAQPGSARPHPAGRAKSMGAQAALGTRLATPALVRDTLGYLADRVGGRLRAAERAGRTVTVRVRFAHLRSVTRSLTLAGAVSTTLTLTEVAAQLALSALDDHPRERHISLLGLSVSNLVDQPALQLELALDLDGNDLRPGAAVGAGRWAVDRSMDAIRAKFGRGSVGYAPVVLSHEDRVPEEFRSLAERG